VSNRIPYRAWQFILPDMEDSAGAAGGTMPKVLSVSGAQLVAPGLQLSARGGIGMIDGNDAIRQAILILLFTIPGERIMRPDYGCDLHRLIFSPNDDTTAGLAIHYIRRAIEKWEPRVDIVALDAGRDPEAPERLNILLVYRVRATLHTEPLTIAVSLAGDKF
jgi:phage baseplate assembly protein W